MRKFELEFWKIDEDLEPWVFNHDVMYSENLPTKKELTAHIGSQGACGVRVREIVERPSCDLATDYRLKNEWRG